MAHGGLEFGDIQLIECCTPLAIQWRSIPSIQFCQSQKLLEALQLQPHSDPRVTPL